MPDTPRLRLTLPYPTDAPPGPFVLVTRDGDNETVLLPCAVFLADARLDAADRADVARLPPGHYTQVALGADEALVEAALPRRVALHIGGSSSTGTVRAYGLAADDATHDPAHRYALVETDDPEAFSDRRNARGALWVTAPDAYGTAAEARPLDADEGAPAKPGTAVDAGA